MATNERTVLIGISGSQSSILKPPPTEQNSKLNSCALEDNLSHESGYKLKIILDREGREDNVPWRSGERLAGVVQVEPIINLDGGEPKKISSIILKAFYTSKTLFETNTVIEIPNKSRFGGATETKVIVNVRKEWHRSFLENGGEGVEIYDGGEAAAIAREIEDTFPFLSDNTTTTTTTNQQTRRERESLRPIITEDIDSNPTNSRMRSLPFVFQLPTTTRVTMSNPSFQPPTNRSILQNYSRTPPASLSALDCKHANVEWAVEAILRFETDESTVPLTSPTSASSSDSPLSPLSPSLSLPTSPLSLAPSLSTSASTSASSIENPIADLEDSLPIDPPSDELPSFISATHDLTSPFSHVGFLTSTPTLLVQRIIFPFEPKDEHIQDLYSTWRPVTQGRWAAVVAKHNGIPLDEIKIDTPVASESKVPAFGRDPRDEALGGTHMGKLRAMKGKLVDQNGGREKWTSFEKRMVYQSKFGRKTGWIRSEVSIPFPSKISRHSTHLPILINLSFVSATRLDENSISKLKFILIEKVIITLALRTMTRGGREERAHCTLEPIRVQEITTFNNGVNGKYLELDPKGVGRDVELKFDLQSDSVASSTNSPSIPLRECSLSLRAPNVEREYILSVTIHCSKSSRSTSFFAFRAPIQILPGDSDPLPIFTEGNSPPLVLNLPVPPIYESESVV